MFFTTFRSTRNKNKYIAYSIHLYNRLHIVYELSALENWANVLSLPLPRSLTRSGSSRLIKCEKCEINSNKSKTNNTIKCNEKKSPVIFARNVSVSTNILCRSVMNRIEARTVVGLNVMTVIVIRKKERNKYHYFFELKHVFNSIQFFVGTNVERNKKRKKQIAGSTNGMWKKNPLKKNFKDTDQAFSICSINSSVCSFFPVLARSV